MQHAGADDERNGQKNRPDRHRASRHDENSSKHHKTEGNAKVMGLDNPRGLERSHHKQENCEHQRQRRQQRIAVSLL